jgi:hypothetical protein
MLCSLHCCLLGFCLVLQNPERGQIIFYVLNSAEDGLTVVGSGLVVGSVCFVGDGVAPTRV